MTHLKNPATTKPKTMNINDQTMTSDLEIENVKSIIFTMYFAKYKFTKQFSVVGTRTYTLMVESLTRILFCQRALLFGNNILIFLRTQHPPGSRRCRQMNQSNKTTKLFLIVVVILVTKRNKKNDEMN